MMVLKWRIVLSSLIVFACVGAVSGAPILDENFDGSSLGTNWSFYNGGGAWSAPVVSGGVVTTSVASTSTASGGLWINTPVVSPNKSAEVLVKFKISLASGTIIPSIGILTGLPVNADMGNAEAWGTLSWTQYTSVATGSTSRIRLDPPTSAAYNSWNDTSYGYKIGGQIKNGQDAYVKLSLDAANHTFSTYASSDGTTWTQTALRDMNATEQAALETGSYYTLLRFVAIGATTADVEVDYVQVVPEPATLGMLACGGLLSLAKRCKK